MKQQLLRHSLGALIGALIVLLGAVAWFYLKRPAEIPEPFTPIIWFENERGYLKGRAEAMGSGKPLLVLIEKKRCRRCKLFEEHFLRDKELKAELKKFIKIRLNISATDNSRNLARRYPYQSRLPALFVQNNVDDMPRPIHVLVDLEQIWMPSPSYSRGNYMPLSPTTITMAINETLKIPRDVLTKELNNS
ncbi:thioredoxin family protein [Dongshaea marina]|uniref:thioredoxin family protein n=1 Tax=Dongshaea marina TaxID=2047966 RepID=UPI000D3EB57F|nr:thioredoxin family protein [Dongshaea marina]